MNAASSSLPSDAFLEQAEGAGRAIDNPVVPSSPASLRPAGRWHRLWRARSPSGEGRPPACPPLARARRLCRGGRAVLLWSLGFFAAAQLALVLTLDHWHPTWTETWHEEKWKQLTHLVAREPDRPLLLMLGSSRVDDAFQAERLNGLPGPGGKPLIAYNFGIPMVGPIRTTLYLDDMLAAGIRPHLLLVEFIPAMLTEAHTGVASEEGFTDPMRLTRSELLHLWPYWVHPRHMGISWLEARLVPWYALRFHLLNAAYATAFPDSKEALSPWDVLPHDDWGFRTPVPFTDEERKRCWEFDCNTYYPTLQRLHVGRRTLQALRDLLERCRQERIPTALVFMPETNTFRSWYRPQGLATSRRLLAELSREYGVLAIDASEWIADKDFRDAHHVEADGARLFTTRLIEELRPVLARP